MRKFQVVILSAFSFALVLLTGCGDSPELRMQQAQIAMANGKPDRAFKIISTVLEDKPNDLKALQIKARAQMLLDHLGDSKKTLDELLEAYPENIDIRRHIVEWTWFRVRSVLNQSDFTTNQKLQSQFDEAMSAGKEQAQWLATQEDTVAESFYYQARYVNCDVQRLRKMLRDQEKSLSHVNLSSHGQNQSSIVSAHLKDQIKDRLDNAIGFLSEVIGLDPGHFQACEMYAGILVQRKYWSDLWVLVQHMLEVEELPVSTAERLVSALMVMPDSEQPKQGRIEVSQKILSAVKKSHKDSPGWQIARGRLHLISGEWSKAQPLLESAIKSRPSDIEAQYLLAQSLYGLKKYDQAKAMLSKLSTKAPRSSQIQTLYGLVLMQAKDNVLAKEALRRATELNPNDSVAREAFLALMAEEGHIDQAQGDIDAYLKRNPADPRAIRFKMQFEQAQGRQKEVIKLLKTVEGLSPLTDKHLRVLVDGYLMVREFSKAKRFARQLVKRNPEVLNNHLLLAETMLMQGQDEQVKQMLAGLQEKFPEGVHIDQMLGRLYLQRQSFDRAVELLQKVVEEQPTNIDARIMLAQGLASLSLVDDALKQLDLVLEQAPQDVRAHSLASRINQFAGRTGKANEHLAQIDENKISEAASPALLAQIKIRKGDIDAAMAICNRAIASGNTDPVLRMLVAGIYIKKENFAQAENHLLALVKSQPNNLQAYSLLSRFYLERDNVDKGLVELATLQGANEALSRLSQASLLQGSGRPQEALARLTPIFDFLIRNRSQYTLMVADAMAKLYVVQGDRTAAHAVYDPLIDADLRVNEARLRQIDLAAPGQQIETVVKQLDDLAAQLTPEQRKLRYLVMVRYKGLGRPDRAMELLDGWLSDEPDQPSLLRWKGELLVSQNKPDQAIRVFEQAVAVAPDAVGLRMLLAQAHVANYDYPGAEAVLLEAAEIDGGARIVSLASLGRMFLAIGLNHQAAETFQELERFGRPNDPRVVFAMGQAYAALKMDDLARQRLGEVPEFAPQYAQAQFLLARLEQNQGEIKSAKQRLQSLTRNPRMATIAVKELMALSLRNRQVEDLVKWSDKALRIEALPPSVKQAWLGVRAKMNADAKDWSTALKTFEQLSQLNPESTSLLAGRIAILCYQKKTEQARRLYRTSPALSDSLLGPLLAIALEEPPAEVEGQAGLPLFLQAMAQGDLDGARSAAESLEPRRTIYKADLLTMIDRSDAGSKQIGLSCARLGLAMVAAEVGLPQLAEEVAEEVVRKSPSMAAAYSVLAQAQLSQGESTEKTWERVRRILPNSHIALYLSIKQKEIELDYEGAAKDMRKLLEYEPGNVHAQYRLAQILQLAQDIDSAISVLEEVHRGQSPYRNLAANDLAYLLATHVPDRLEEAYQLAQEAIKETPRSNPALQDTLGWVEHLRGHQEEALKQISQAVFSLKGVPSVHYHLGIVYRELKNPQWAHYHLREAASGPDDNSDVKKARLAMEDL